MKIFTFRKRLFWLILLACGFLASCEDKMEKHYEKPEWVRGSIWEILESDGNYSLFLQGVELSGFRPYLEGSGLLTVMAPDDQAVSAYLSEKGYSSLSALSAAELKKLFGFHLLYYSFHKEDMANFRPEGDGATDDGSEILDPGMYYKFRSRSNDATTKLTAQNEIGATQEVTVYHLERFLPVFSHYLFTTKRIDAKTNYEYFYPNSTWTGEGGFNVSEASVQEYEIAAHNGYVYKIDRVLDPLETLYNEIKNREDYSIFTQLYDRFSYYQYDYTLSNDFGEAAGADSLYLHLHQSPLAPIALEWPTTNYIQLDTLGYKSYSLFAPNDQALQAFYAAYWHGYGYTSVYDLDPLVTKTLLNEHVYEGSMVFPEEITSGKVTNSSGVVSFDPYQIPDKRICVNGSFYGLNQVQAPNLFYAVTGPAYRQPDYIYFLYAISQANLTAQYNSTQEYTLFIPHNETMIAAGYELNEYIQSKILEYEGLDGMETAGESVLRPLVNVHTVLGSKELISKGTQVLANVVPYNYLFVKDGKITCSNNFNQIINPEMSGYDPFVEVEEISLDGGAWNNGRTYAYRGIYLLDGDQENTNDLQYLLANMNDRRYVFYAFSQLMKQAGMFSNNTMTDIVGRYVAFIPKNDVIYQALFNNEIPGAEGLYFDEAGQLQGGENADAAMLKEYLKNYFVVGSQSTTVPYPGSDMQSGLYFTFAGDQIRYNDTNGVMSIQLPGSSTVSYVSADYDYFPLAYSDGAFHLIESLL